MGMSKPRRPSQKSAREEIEQMAGGSGYEEVIT